MGFVNKGWFEDADGDIKAVIGGLPGGEIQLVECLLPDTGEASWSCKDSGRDDVYSEPKVTLNHQTIDGIKIGLDPSWEIYTRTSDAKLTLQLVEQTRRVREIEARTLFPHILNRVARSKLEITDIVLLAGGTMHSGRSSPGFGCRVLPSRSIRQLALVRELRTFLQRYASDKDKNISIKAQDPGYSDFEKDFLSRIAHVEVYEDPDIFKEINSGSLLVAIEAPYSVWISLSESTTPAAMYCNDIPRRLDLELSRSLQTSGVRTAALDVGIKSGVSLRTDSVETCSGRHGTGQQGNREEVESDVMEPCDLKVYIETSRKVQDMFSGFVMTDWNSHLERTVCCFRDRGDGNLFLERFFCLAPT